MGKKRSSTYQENLEPEDLPEEDTPVGWEDVEEVKPSEEITVPSAPIPDMLKDEEPLPEKEEVPVDTRPRVALKVFIASGGIRWDQMAGFKSYATRKKMGPLSIPEWRKAFSDFMTRSVH